MSEKTVLYISYNGIREPLVCSQVLNYLEGLSKRGYTFILVTFERESFTETELKTLQKRLEARGILWERISGRSGKNTIGAVYSFIQGLVKCLKLSRSHKAGIIHARSFIPALIASVVKACSQVPFLYDIRGFWIDEKMYKGRVSEDSSTYQLGKWLETVLYRYSDAIVSLTHAGLNELRATVLKSEGQKQILDVIPTCVNTDKFSLKGKHPERIITFGYVGSLGRGYMAKELLDFFRFIQNERPESRYLIITKSDHRVIHAMASEAGIDASRLVVKSVEPDAVSDELHNIDVGLSFIEPHYSKMASCPTKTGEYLATGIPVIANTGIGDIDTIMGANTVGVVINSFSQESFKTALAGIEPMIRNTEIALRCRETAERYFSLEKGIKQYSRIYDRMIVTKNKKAGLCGEC